MEAFLRTAVRDGAGRHLRDEGWSFSQDASPPPPTPHPSLLCSPVAGPPGPRLARPGSRSWCVGGDVSRGSPAPKASCGLPCLPRAEPRGAWQRPAVLSFSASTVMQIAPRPLALEAGGWVPNLPRTGAGRPPRLPAVLFAWLCTLFEGLGWANLNPVGAPRGVGPAAGELGTLKTFSAEPGTERPTQCCLGQLQSENSELCNGGTGGCPGSPRGVGLRAGFRARSCRVLARWPGWVPLPDLGAARLVGFAGGFAEDSSSFLRLTDAGYGPARVPAFSV